MSPLSIVQFGITRLPVACWAKLSHGKNEVPLLHPVMSQKLEDVKPRTKIMISVCHEGQSGFGNNEFAHFRLI